VTTPLMQLQDPQQTKVIIVTLAETTPVLEAAGLQADLRRAGIEPWAWVVNQSLAVVPTTSPLLMRRAADERARIADVATNHAARYAVVGLQAVEPVGAERLVALTHVQPSGVPA
jgi:arsenite-transporting ATPase